LRILRIYGPSAESPWYRNTRGEWRRPQFILFVLLAFGPPTHPALPPWSEPWAGPARLAGSVLIAVGALLALAGVLWLGRNLTPFVCPKAGSVLLERGPYRLVRHPIYGGLFLMSLGWGFWVQGWLTLGWVLLLVLLFDRKAALEEAWLLRSFPGYAAYRKRVRKLIPFLY
jgi:protein-S-isoprenylcysteine O-methyltransferase Ste14